MKQNNKAIAGIIIATIALASVAVAVSAEGEGGVQPAAIMPGAITTEHFADGAVTDGKILGGTITNASLDSNIIGDTEVGTLTNGSLANGIIWDAQVGDNALTNGSLANGIIWDTQVGDNALTNDSLANSIIGDTEIVPGAVTSGKLAGNAIPNVMNYTTTPLSTTNTTFNSSDLFNASGQYWNTTIELSRTADLSVAWTGKDVWVTSPGNLSVNCTIYNVSGVIKTSYPSGGTDGIKVADDAYGNLSASVNFYATGLPAETYTISMQIKNSGDAATVGVKEQAIVATAYPA